MNALQICGISVISMEIESSAGIYSHADLADFLFRYYYVVHECTTDLRNQRNLRGKNIQRGYILTQISLISQIFYSDTIM